MALRDEASIALRLSQKSRRSINCASPSAFPREKEARRHGTSREASIAFVSLKKSRPGPAPCIHYPRKRSCHLHFETKIPPSGTSSSLSKVKTKHQLRFALCISTRKRSSPSWHFERSNTSKEPSIAFVSLKSQDEASPRVSPSAFPRGKEPSKSHYAREALNLTISPRL
jgi:hypothetical protein